VQCDVEREISGSGNNQKDEEVDLSIGGLRNDADGQRFNLKWLNAQLKVGDVVTIAVVETDQPSDPIKVVTEAPDFIEQQERKYYKRMQKKYGKQEKESQ
jgi:sRNA-binding carbon storage regulator CsrA